MSKYIYNTLRTGTMTKFTRWLVGDIDFPTSLIRFWLIQFAIF